MFAAPAPFPAGLVPRRPRELRLAPCALGAGHGGRAGDSVGREAA